LKTIQLNVQGSPDGLFYFTAAILDLPGLEGPFQELEQVESPGVGLSAQTLQCLAAEFADRVSVLDEHVRHPGLHRERGSVFSK